MSIRLAVMKLALSKSQRKAIISILILMLLLPALSGVDSHDHAPDFFAESSHIDDRPHQHHDHPIRVPASDDTVEWLPVAIPYFPVSLTFPDLTDPVFSIDRPPEMAVLYT